MNGMTLQKHGLGMGAHVVCALCSALR